MYDYGIYYEIEKKISEIVHFSEIVVSLHAKKDEI